MPIVLLGSCRGLPGLPLIGLALNVPLSRLERGRTPSEGDKMSLLLEVKKPLERTTHFFGPGDGECVNATGQLVDGVRVELTFYDMMSCTPQCYPSI